MQIQFLLNYCQATSTFACGCCHYLLLHTVNVDARVSEWPFFGREENQKPRVPVPSLQGMECSKCGVAFVAMCEIWFGEGCHLKGAGSAVMTAPQHSLTRSHCLFPAASVSLHRYLSIYPSHILSHLFSRSLLASQWLFYWGPLKPDVPVLRGWRGRWGGEGQPNDL